jgi:hypothetical protein
MRRPYCRPIGQEMNLEGRQVGSGIVSTRPQHGVGPTTTLVDDPGEV